MKTKVNTREEILNASVKLFAKNGFSATSIRHIAHEVNITEGSIYNHFASKQEIINTVIGNFIEMNKSVGVDEIVYTDTIDETTIREWVNCVSLFFDRPDLQQSIYLCKIMENQRCITNELRSYFQNFFALQKKDISTIISRSCAYRKIKIDDENLIKSSQIINGILMNYYYHFSEMRNIEEILEFQSETLKLILFMVKRL